MQAGVGCSLTVLLAAGPGQLPPQDVLTSSVLGSAVPTLVAKWDSLHMLPCPPGLEFRPESSFALRALFPQEMLTSKSKNYKDSET